VTPDAFRAALAQHTDEVFLHCLTIDHPSLSPAIRIVNNTVDLERTAGTFIGFPFSVRLQLSSDEMDATAEIVVDNVDQRIVAALRGLSYGAKVTYEAVLASAPNSVQQGPFEYEIQGFSANLSTVTLSISFALGFLSEAFPKDYFAPWNASSG
jgi:hypothetical protein